MVLLEKLMVHNGILMETIGISGDGFYWAFIVFLEGCKRYVWSLTYKCSIMQTNEERLADRCASSFLSNTVGN